MKLRKPADAVNGLLMAGRAGNGEKLGAKTPSDEETVHQIFFCICQ